MHARMFNRFKILAAKAASSSQRLPFLCVKEAILVEFSIYSRYGEKIKRQTRFSQTVKPDRKNEAIFPGWILLCPMQNPALWDDRV